MPSRRDCFPREFPPLSVPSTRVLIRHPISANPLDGLFPIDWMGMMTAQERKDVRRVQKSRDIWKKRAGRRGEDRRRIRQRHQEVDRSRTGWRERALEAENRTRQLEIEHHQLKSALTRAPELPPSTIPIFFKLFTSPSGLELSPLVPRLEQRAECLSARWCGADFLGASLHHGHGLGLTGRLALCTTSAVSPR